MKFHLFIVMASFLVTSLAAFGQVINNSMMMRINNCSSPSTFNGQNASRYMYQSANINDPATCTSEVQSAYCSFGTLGSYSGSYANASCTVSRTRYSTASTTCPTPVVAETQTKNCTAGSCGSFSGTYTYSSGTQNPTSNTISIWKTTAHSDPYACNPYACGCYETGEWVCVGGWNDCDNDGMCGCPNGYWEISCPDTCYNTCYNNYNTCDANGTATKNCTVTTNTTAGIWGAYSPNAANYYSNNSCTTRY